MTSHRQSTSDSNSTADHRAAATTKSLPGLDRGVTQTVATTFRRGFYSCVCRSGRLRDVALSWMLFRHWRLWSSRRGNAATASSDALPSHHGHISAEEFAADQLIGFQPMSQGGGYVSVDAVAIIRLNLPEGDCDIELDTCPHSDLYHHGIETLLFNGYRLPSSSIQCRESRIKIRVQAEMFEPQEEQHLVFVNRRIKTENGEQVGGWPLFGLRVRPLHELINGLLSQRAA